ncbi:prenyltransferase/squalene oxidase repeat-containing protein [Sorangium sp. So ce131]|uniref:prenyltransferase/squalene oxidase repeat-containing protein n=1 Tax=Sorangium sp. So ce131 TaxID=3133282 RepID=UPI003F628ABC
MSPDGAVRDEPRSRVLESALMLRLLRLERAHPEAQTRIVQYLETERRTKKLGPFDAALTRAALAAPADPPALEDLDRCFSGSGHFAARRKRMLFRAVVALMSGTSFDDEFEEADFIPRDEYQSWVRVEVVALKILYATNLGRHGLIKKEDVTAIAEALMKGTSRSQMVLRQLLTLFALRTIPDQERAVRLGTERLVAHQRGDGGLPSILGMEIFCTATAGLALASAGPDRNRSTLVCLADYLAGQQQPDGGWAYAEGVDQTDVDDTSYCLEVLSSTGLQKYAGPSARAAAYLLAIQGKDGGFPSFARGADSEIAMTAGAIMALAPTALASADILHRSAHYILERQKPDGTFDRSWSLSEASEIYRTMVAMQRLRVEPTSELSKRIDGAVSRSRKYLEGAQNDDGGWGHVRGATSDVISTSYALIALSHIGGRAALERGLLHLLSRQQAHGGFVSVPDQVGPRPIPYDVPLLADNFALLALNHGLAAQARST